MQKKIIALAVAGLASTAAFAQSNVTVYGVVDASQVVVKSSGATAAGATPFAGLGAGPATGVNQSSVGRLDAHGSYLGFKGVEDLGNGLKAVFVYETALATDTNATGSTFGTRDAYVGLAGGFGTVALGTLTHPLRAFGQKVELLPGAAGFGTTASVTGTIAGAKTGADDRAQNAVAYISPSFSGFSATVAYVNGEKKTDSVTGNDTTVTPAPAVVNGNNVTSRQWQIAAQYDNGPLFVGAGYHRINDAQAQVGLATGGPIVTGFSGVDTAKASVIRAVAVYTLPTNTKLTALFDRTKADTSIGEVKRNAFSLGVAQAFGKNTVGFEYGHSFNLRADGDKVDDTGSSIYTLVYGYDLSKRTSVHARYSRLNNGDYANNNFYNLPVTGNGEVSGIGSNYTGFGVGLRHTF